MNDLQGANAKYFPPPFSAPEPQQCRGGLTKWDNQPFFVRPHVPSGTIGATVVQAPSHQKPAQELLSAEIANLKQAYTFAGAPAITDFLIYRRSIRAVLREAVPQLRCFFGNDRLFNLELSVDEDFSQMLYAVAIWPEDAKSAARALDEFVDQWWLDRMSAATSELSFVYKLV